MQKNCKDIEPIMLNYVSGDILGSQKRVLDEHLSECQKCSDEMVNLQRLDLNLLDLKDEEADPPGELKDTILKELAYKKKEVNLHRIFSPIAILSTVTIALTVIVFILVGKVGNVQIYSRAPKPQMVKILFFSDDAKDVSLVGDFNGWGTEPMLLKNIKNDTWEAELKLIPGMYEYNLIVDGERWVANPNSKAYVPDGFGGTNSVVIVDEKGEIKIEANGKSI